MNEAGNGNARQEAMEEEAIMWFVRMREPHSASDDAKLKAWIEKAPEHGRAYEWAKRHFDDAALLKDSPRHGRQRGSRSSFRLLTAAMAAVLIAAIAVGLTFRSRDRIDEGAFIARSAPILETEPSQIRSTKLNGGIDIVMDADSRVAVSIDDRERRIRLDRGRARLVVRSDDRPFVMEAGEGELLAKDGTFDVSRTGDGNVEVAVLSGEVELRKLVRPATMQLNSQRLKAGQSLLYRSNDFRPFTPSGTSADYRHWPDGWAEYRSVPLRVLVVDANRYARKPIFLEGSGIGDLLVSGRFRLTETNRFAARIAELFDLQSSHQADGIHLLRPEIF